MVGFFEALRVGALASGRGGALASGRLGKHTVSSALRTRKLSPIEGRSFAHAGAGPESHTVLGA